MSGNVGFDGGAGGVDPQFQVDEGHDNTGVDPSQTQAKVNVLPKGDELGEVDEVGEIGSGIPRPPVIGSGEHAALQETLDVDPDNRGALGGSALTVAVETADGEDVVGDGVAQLASGGYQTQIHPDGRVVVDCPDGAQHTGQVGEDGQLTLDIQETDEHHPARVNFGEPPVDPGEVTIQVDPLDGGPPEELTLDVEETTDGLRTEREEDLENSPEKEKITWVDHLKAFNDLMDLLEAWIRERMGKGKARL